MRLCIRATGARSGSEVRKMAVPGARCGWRLRSISDRSASRTFSRRAFSVRIAAPRRQVHITTTSAAPRASGSQAPSGIFRRLEEMKVMSISPSGTTSRAVCQPFQFHSRGITTAARMVSTNIEPVTAMP